MYISLPIIVMAVAVTHSGVAAVPVMPHQSSNSNDDVNQFARRSVKSTIFKGLIPWAIAVTVLGGHLLVAKHNEGTQLKDEQEERIEPIKQDEMDEQEQEESIDGDEDKSGNMDLNKDFVGEVDDNDD